MTDFANACKERISKGICKADCCGNVPVPVTLWNKYRHSVSMKYQLHFLGPLVLIETEDDKCIFLDRSTFLCTIYEERPDICREFGLDPESILLQCPYLDINGRVLSRPVRRRRMRKAGNFVQVIKERFMGMKNENDISD